MCRNLKNYLAALLLCLSTGAWAQIITADPPFPTVNQEVTITFDASQGTGGLANCGCDVYVHTGVITNNSSGPGDWQNVPTEWGVANADWKMTRVTGQANLYTYTISPSIMEFYNVEAGVEVLQMAFVFRNADGSMEGKGEGGTDIYYDVYSESGALSVILLSPENDFVDVSLGQQIPVVANASATSTLSLYDNGVLLTEETDATELNYSIAPTVSGSHLVEVVANDGTSSDTARFSYQATLRTRFINPASEIIFAESGEVINVLATAGISSELELTDNGTLLTQFNGGTISYNLTTGGGGLHTVVFSATYNGETASSSFVYLSPNSLNIADPPAGSKNGITYLNDTDVRLQLYAPNKDIVFVIGDFNNWNVDGDYLMNRSVDGNTYWLEISGLTPGEEYGFQYLVDGEIRTADPYSRVVLDQYNDPFIPTATYPNIHPYPVGQTTGIVSLLQPGAENYDWQVDDFTAPPSEELVVYELLMRDFLDRHDYQTLIDTLDYLDRLGINAIELMPISEFEGNNSWGYNPSFHMALDKYYGTINDFKAFVDECHARGIAVILDVVYNHAFSQSPLAQLYWDATNFRPSAENPWLNVTPRHPFNVGYDFNHESQATRDYVIEVMQYWLSEFRVDGFRFDLSKGFTQTQNSDVGAWGNYDAGRIATIKLYADAMRAINPDAYVILEHFADWDEEEELADYGALLWGGGTHNAYKEASLGFNANLNLASHTTRGWDVPAVIAFMESHDEERLMYENLNFGNSSDSYDVQDVITGFRRIELASTFFYTIPGPKMLWQFGELGYDYSINHCVDGSVDNNCRLDPKPIRWDYNESPNRKRIYDVVRSLIHLKTEYDVFNTTDFALDVGGYGKKIHLNSADMKVAVLGNFDVVTTNISNPFQETGWWYEYFTGDSIQVTNTAEVQVLAPGEYRLYTNVKLDAPLGGYLTALPALVPNAFQMVIAPNPTQENAMINYVLPTAGPVQLDVYTMSGQHLQRLVDGQQAAGAHTLTPEFNLSPGTYLLRLVADGKVEVAKLMVTK